MSVVLDIKDKICGIYLIVNPKGRMYVGQSKNIKKRMYSHNRLSGKRSPLISKSIEKYGFSNHSVTILEECSVDELDKKERFYIDKFKTNLVKYPNKKGLNLTDGGEVRKEDYLSQTLYGLNTKPKEIYKAYITKEQISLIKNFSFNVEKRSVERFRARAILLISYINLIGDITLRPVAFNKRYFMSVLSLRGSTFNQFRDILIDLNLISLFSEYVPTKISNRYITIDKSKRFFHYVDTPYFGKMIYKLHNKHSVDYENLLSMVENKKI